MKIRNHSLPAVAVAMLAMACAAAQAQSLSDPTRPPASLGSAATADGTPEASGLQSIIRSNIGRPAAIINGQYVVLGGRVGDAKLVKIGDDSVTLKTATGTETLMLVSGVEKQAVADRKKESDSIRKNRNEVSR